MRSTNNEHATCPTCLAVLPTDPYRSNYILPQKTHNMFLSKVSAKFITLSERFPKAIKTIKSIPSMVLYFVIGSIAISGTIAGVSALCWFLFPGLYRIGFHVGNYVFGQGTFLPGYAPPEPLAAWAFGLLLMTLPVTAPFVGSSIVRKLNEK